MSAIELTINGRATAFALPGRCSLADALRDGAGLTGTHLGCEHGVCGACTVLIDGEPARSCITFAAACAGASVSTIEGLDDDAIATELRSAFSRHHALQCGYCTPGMLISARDLVQRLSAPDETAIRLGLSGNLCRCTGYVGIVNAVKEVIAARRANGVAAANPRTTLGPVGAQASAPALIVAAPKSVETMAPTVATASTDFTPAHVFQHSFRLGASPERVYEFFADIRAVAAAIPGLTLTQADERHASGLFSVGLGPVRAQFAGDAEISRDPATRSGRVVAAGGDASSASRARGMLDYRVEPAEAGALVSLSIGYSLTGLLAQLGRPGLIEAVARGLIAQFAGRAEAALGGPAIRPFGFVARLRALAEAVRAAVFGPR